MQNGRKHWKPKARKASSSFIEQDNIKRETKVCDQDTTQVDVTKVPRRSTRLHGTRKTQYKCCENDQSKGVCAGQGKPHDVRDEVKDEKKIESKFGNRSAGVNMGSGIRRSTRLRQATKAMDNIENDSLHAEKNSPSTTDGRVVCPSCSQEFPGADNMSRNLQWKTDADLQDCVNKHGIKLVCVHCAKVYSSEAEHQDDDVPGDQRNYARNTRSGRQNQTEKRRNYPYNCANCPLGFHRAGKLIQHQWEMHRPEPPDVKPETSAVSDLDEPLGKEVPCQVKTRSVQKQTPVKPTQVAAQQGSACTKTGQATSSAVSGQCSKPSQTGMGQVPSQSRFTADRAATLELITGYMCTGCGKLLQSRENLEKHQKTCSECL